ncbi:LysR family transcriptional regulator [Aureimonas populi]|uniref:LysR family transcriptional regulator n=1 Tax=Aureimonas populi TaxID=1701758 RepID=A0ABW5CLX0_9HYPH|nr:LysR family transcriptional regulator [Aureimonas populi]
MNLKQMEAFYWLTQLKSHQRVADHLGLTQPAVSARISGLEESLGVQLVDRGQPGFALTEQGYEVAEYAETFLNLAETLRSRLHVKRKRRFSIGLVGMVTMTWGIALRAKIAAQPGGAMVDVHSAPNVEIRQKLRSGALDMAFVTGEAGLSQVQSSFSVLYRVGWVARPDVIGGAGRVMTPRQLRELPLIFYPHSSPLFGPVADMVEETRRRPNARHTASSLGMICEMVRAGYGASALPLAAVEREIANGMLVEIPTTVQLAPLDVRCVHLNKARKSQSEEVFAMAHQAAREWCVAHPRYMTFKEG